MNDTMEAPKKYIIPAMLGKPERVFTSCLHYYTAMGELTKEEFALTGITFCPDPVYKCALCRDSGYQSIRHPRDPTCWQARPCGECGKMRGHVYGLPGEFQGMTWGSFIPLTSQNQAFRVLDEMFRNGEVVPSIGFLGNTGVGKSALASVVTKYASVKWNRQAHYRHTTLLANERGQEYRDDPLAIVLSAPLLFLDELGHGRDTAYGGEVNKAWNSLYANLMNRLDNNLPIVWTSNFGIKDLPGMDAVSSRWIGSVKPLNSFLEERVVSRLKKNALIFVLLGSDQRQPSQIHWQEREDDPPY